MPQQRQTRNSEPNPHTTTHKKPDKKRKPRGLAKPAKPKPHITHKKPGKKRKPRGLAKPEPKPHITHKKPGRINNITENSKLTRKNNSNSSSNSSSKTPGQLIFGPRSSSSSNSSSKPLGQLIFGPSSSSNSLHKWDMTTNPLGSSSRNESPYNTSAAEEGAENKRTKSKKKSNLHRLLYENKNYTPNRKRLLNPTTTPVSAMSAQKVQNNREIITKPYIKSLFADDKAGKKGARTISGRVKSGPSSPINIPGNLGKR
jgi:hypothetical protein